MNATSYTAPMMDFFFSFFIDLCFKMPESILALVILDVIA